MTRCRRRQTASRGLKKRFNRMIEELNVILWIHYTHTGGRFKVCCHGSLHVSAQILACLYSRLVCLFMRYNWSRSGRSTIMDGLFDIQRGRAPLMKITILIDKWLSPIMKLWSGKLKSHSRRGESGTFVVILFSIIWDNTGALIGVMIRRPQKVSPGGGISRTSSSQDGPAFNWNIEEKLEESFILPVYAVTTIKTVVPVLDVFKHAPSGKVQLLFYSFNGFLLLLLCKVV